MSSLPQKSIKGAVFKTWAIQSIDKLIDYLSGTFIRGGKGISVRRSAGVTIIELDKQPEQVQQNATGGGTGVTQDISASVSGGTASIALSGSTSHADFVGTGSVSISGNTNGQIEVNGGPFLPVRPSSIGFNGSHVMTHDGWAYMACQIDSSGNSAESAFAYLRVVYNSTTTDYLVVMNSLMEVPGNIGGSVMVPVASGSTVSAYIDLPPDGNYRIPSPVLDPFGIIVYD